MTDASRSDGLVDDLALEPGPSGDDPTAVSAGGRGGAILVVVGLLLVALLAGAVFFGLQVRRAAEQNAGRQAALAGARQFAVNFTTINFATLDADITNVVRLTTGDFQTEYNSGVETIKQTVTDGKIESQGEALESALASYGENEAVALVIVDSTVKNAATPQANQVRYRLQIDLTRVGGRWLTSGVQFVT